MRKFQFRLETVLRYRRRVEERKERAFLERHRRRLAAEKRLSEILGERERMLALDAPVEVHILEWRERYLTRLADLADQQRQVVAMLREEEERAKEEWLTARRDREALDRLREKAAAEHRAEELREGQREMDDWAVLRSGVAPRAG